MQAYWSGPDAGGHPVLVVRIGEAIARCNAEDGVQFANAIITQVRKHVGAVPRQACVSSELLQRASLACEHPAAHRAGEAC